MVHSGLPKPHASCALAKTFVSPGRMIMGGPAFAIGAKDIPAQVSRNGYIPRLKWISTKFVLLWDEADKAGLAYQRYECAIAHRASISGA